MLQHELLDVYQSDIRAGPRIVQTAIRVLLDQSDWFGHGALPGHRDVAAQQL